VALAVTALSGERRDVDGLVGLLKPTTQRDNRAESRVVDRLLIWSASSTGSIAGGGGLRRRGEELDVSPKWLAR
jgi:hypothetical protein